MNNELINSLISNGFAVGVAGFLLIRLERELKDLAKAIDNLRRCSVCKVDTDSRVNRKVEPTQQ